MCELFSVMVLLRSSFSACFRYSICSYNAVVASLCYLSLTFVATFLSTASIARSEGFCWLFEFGLLSQRRCSGSQSRGPSRGDLSTSSFDLGELLFVASALTRACERSTSLPCISRFCTAFCNSSILGAWGRRCVADLGCFRFNCWYFD